MDNEVAHLVLFDDSNVVLDELQSLDSLDEVLLVQVLL